jgi:uncharacterized membrane protein YwzB
MKLSRNGRVSLARLLWIGVAIMLAYRGLVPHFSNIEATWAKVLAVVLALVIGFGKGKFVLRKSALRSKRFIARRPERDWFWFSIHPIFFLLIPLMIWMGSLLRKNFAADYPALIVGVYLGIGMALLIGSSGFSAPVVEDGDPLEASAA